jgi:hypothetical protein
MEQIKVNEICPIGLPSCGYGFESAKMCFVACPSDKKHDYKLNIIRDIISSKNYECHIALKKSNPGKNAFCTKICSKIIQSQFCIVLLDPSSNGKRNEYPNPNVHLEYGMMISRNKYIIPLQGEKYKLPFNISPLDTIKYNSKNFRMKLNEAVENAIQSVGKKNEGARIPIEPEILDYYKLSNYQVSQTNVAPYGGVFKLGSHLGFNLFDYSQDFKFVGVFYNLDEKNIIANTGLLLTNIAKHYHFLNGAYTDVLARKTIFNESGNATSPDFLINNITVDLIVNDKIDKEKMKGKIEKYIGSEIKHELSILTLKEMKEAIENEFNVIEKL